jgi:hypothetical protein
MRQQGLRDVLPIPHRGACCAVVTTAEYCNEVIGALARNVAKLLDPPLGDEVGPAVHPPALPT